MLNATIMKRKDSVPESQSPSIPADIDSRDVSLMYPLISSLIPVHLTLVITPWRIKINFISETLKLSNPLKIVYAADALEMDWNFLKR